MYFRDYHTPIQIVAKPTEALDTALIYLSLANPVLKPGGLQEPRITKVHHYLNSLGGRWGMSQGGGMGRVGGGGGGGWGGGGGGRVGESVVVGVGGQGGGWVQIGGVLEWERGKE